MTSYSASLDLESALSVPTRCPGCAAPGLHPVVDGEQTLFRCDACARTWHVELGWVTPVHTAPVPHVVRPAAPSAPRVDAAGVR